MIKTKKKYPFHLYQCLCPVSSLSCLSYLFTLHANCLLPVQNARGS